MPVHRRPLRSRDLLVHTRTPFSGDVALLEPSHWNSATHRYAATIVARRRLSATAKSGSRRGERYYTTSTLTSQLRQCPIQPLEFGRWVAAERPDVADPAAWTRKTCAAWLLTVGP